jgi:hypothetical protein
MGLHQRLSAEDGVGLQVPSAPHQAGSEGVLMAKVIYHLDAQHPQAHPTLEHVEELVGAQAYDEPS